MPRGALTIQSSHSRDSAVCMLCYPMGGLIVGTFLLAGCESSNVAERSIGPSMRPQRGYLGERAGGSVLPPPEGHPSYSPHIHPTGKPVSTVPMQRTLASCLYSTH